MCQWVDVCVMYGPVCDIWMMYGKWGYVLGNGVVYGLVGNAWMMYVPVG